MTTEGTELARKAEFEKHHEFIKANMVMFQQVGEALTSIRDQQLFLVAGYGTFEAYCQEEFSFTSRHGNRMIQAAKVAKEHGVPNEYEARKLAEVPEEHRAAVITEVKSRTGGKVTGHMIEDVGHEIAGEPKEEEDTDLRPSAEPIRLILVAIATLESDLLQLTSSVGRFIDLVPCRAAIQTLRSQIKPMVPTHRCYACGGEGCELCKGLGWIPQELFDSREEEFRGAKRV